jgi:Xaa-Pro aminopeptidase
MAGQFGLRLGPPAGDYTEGFVNFARMREERLAKFQTAMKKNGVAVALLCRPENIRYVTGTKFYTFVERLRYTLAFAEYPPIQFEYFGNPPGECPWIKPENRRLSHHWADQAPGPEAVLDTAKRFAADIKKELQQKGLEKERLGIDSLDEPGRQALIEAGINIVNVMPVMLEARAIKTKDEINCLHMAAVIADSGHYAMYEAIKPGVRERDIVAAGIGTMYRAGAEGVADLYVHAGGLVGGGSANSDKIIQVGDVVTIDVFKTTYMGYNTCYYRIYLVSRKPTIKEKDMYKAANERVYKVIDAIKPGVTTADVAANWASAKDKKMPCEDVLWCDELGHGLGLALYEYPIINRLWSPDHPQTIVKGMTMAVEATEFDPLVGRVKVEEMLTVTDTGVEIFSRMPVKDLMICSPIIVAD